MSIRDMQVMLFPSKYIQGNGAAQYLPEILAKFGERPFMVATRSMMETAIKIMGETGRVEQFGHECTRKEIERLTNMITEYKATSLTAFGGGKVIDCCKIIADNLKIPSIVVPTIASTDAPCSGCAVVYTEEGVFEKVYFQKRNPDVVVVDTEIASKAPVRLMISGMGDALATFFEANSCHKSGSMNECRGMRTITAQTVSKLCLDMLLKYGRQAVRDVERGIVSEAIEAVIEANTLLSGIGFESGGIAAAHSVHNGLTILPETHGLYHGEKVAFGILVGLQLYDELNMKDEIYDFLIDVGLPVCFEDLGINNITDEQIKTIAENCCCERNIMYHEPVEINVEIVSKALRDADAMGINKKKK